MKTLGFIVAFILLAGGAFFVAQEWQRLFPAHQAIETGCVLTQQTCVTELPDGGELSLSITPKPIPLMLPIDFRLLMQNSELQAVHVDITGINMEMGLNRVVFEAEASDQTWQGQTILPICTQRKMQWQAQLVLKQNETFYRLNYRFETQR